MQKNIKFIETGPVTPEKLIVSVWRKKIWKSQKFLDKSK